MTDAEFILSVLEDNQPHSQADLLRRSFEQRGCGLTVHSRIADLRRKGYFIACERVPGADRGEAWAYTLFGPLSESDQSLAEAGGSLVHAHEHAEGRSDSESEPVPLFTFPRSPEWA